MKTIEIVRMDHHGRGIGYIDGKIVFVPNALVGEIIDIEITKEKKKYLEGKIMNIKKCSLKRKEALCPYFGGCGGCNLLHLNYEDTISYKVDKIKSILSQAKVDFSDIEVIKNKKDYYYRNKIELKIVDGKVGYYKKETHELIEITKCLIANECINNFLNDISYLNLKNADLTIRCNYNAELLIIINSNDDLLIDAKYLSSKHKIVGIIFNKKCVYGENHFIDVINHHLFRVSYDAFFQVNPYVTSEMFNLIEQHIPKNSVVMDLYSGVGTLGIIASKKSKKVYSIEIAKVINKINDDVDAVIVDPPRRGLDKNTIDFLKDNNFKSIIYISCDPMTLSRDLKLLENKYKIEEFKIMDMFSYTYHLESFVLLKKVA